MDLLAQSICVNCTSGRARPCFGGSGYSCRHDAKPEIFVDHLWTCRLLNSPLPFLTLPQYSDLYRVRDAVIHSSRTIYGPTTFTYTDQNGYTIPRRLVPPTPLFIHIDLLTRPTLFMAPSDLEVLYRSSLFGK